MPIRLTKLQLVLGGAALKLVKSIPAGTDDGYDLAMKKLCETYHNPVGLATALLNASETEKCPRIHQEQIPTSSLFAPPCWRRRWS